MITTTTLTEEQQRNEKLHLFIRRIKEGKTVKMSAQDYWLMLAEVEKLNNEDYKQFGKLVSTLDKNLSIGITQVYDVRLKE